MNDKPTIAIVGNSPCILEHEWGEEIDSHDIVVRFNNFVTEGYEKYCGKKTTDICFNPWTQYNKHIHQLSKEHRLFFYADEAYITIMRELKERNALNINDVTVIDNQKYYIELRDKLNAKNNWQGSSGLVICQMMSDIYPNSQIDVYGITFFKDTVNKKIHHMDGSILESNHDPNAEWVYYEKYLKNKINLHI